MVDIGAIAGALQSIKVASDLVKGAIGLRDAKIIEDRLKAVVGNLIEAQVRVLEAQATISALLDSERELKRKIAEFEEWAAEKQRYELVGLVDGALAYAAKEAMRGPEPPHYLCPACFQRKEKSIMQGSVKRGIKSLTCPVCELEVTELVDPDWTPNV